MTTLGISSNISSDSVIYEEVASSCCRHHRHEHPCLNSVPSAQATERRVLTSDHRERKDVMATKALAPDINLCTVDLQTTVPSVSLFHGNEESATGSGIEETNQSNPRIRVGAIHDRLSYSANMSNGRPAKKQRSCSAKSVWFSQVLEQEMNCRPYCAGQSDAETLRLCHAKLWYEPIEYLSFLKDRADTIRIYKSLNGGEKMMDYYLGRHYSTHGLEHLMLLASPTHPQQQRRQPRSQQLLTTKIMAEQRREGSDPETIRQVAVAHSALALAAALLRAAGSHHDEVVSVLEDAAEVAGSEGYYSSSEEEDEQPASLNADGGQVTSLLSSCPTANPINLPALLSPLPNICGPQSPIDLQSLRRMNSHLVATMKARSSASSSSSSSDIMMFTTNTPTSGAGLLTAADRTREMLRTSLVSCGVFSPLVRSQRQVVLGTAGGAGSIAAHLEYPTEQHASGST